MEALLGPLLSQIPSLTPIALVDILLTAFLFYQFLINIRGRRAASVLAGLGLMGILYAVAVLFHLELLRALLQATAPYLPLALILLFQAEIRRMLARIGRQGLFVMGSRVKRREFVEELLLAVEQLSKTRTGALIVIERDIGLRTFVESGVVMDSIVSRDLLLAIFQPGGALHDGAVILQNEKIAAAACFLPLSTNPTLMNSLGTRHRAAIGITEDSDSLAVVVSEETGDISVAAGGEIERGITLARLEERIAQHLRGQGQKPAGEAPDSESAFEDSSAETLERS